MPVEAVGIGIEAADRDIDRDLAELRIVNYAAVDLDRPQIAEHVAGEQHGGHRRVEVIGLDPAVAAERGAVDQRDAAAYGQRPEVGGVHERVLCDSLNGGGHIERCICLCAAVIYQYGTVLIVKHAA